MGEKTVYYSQKVFIEGEDANTLKVGDTVTFINWGNLIITDVVTGASGSVNEVKAKLNLENTVTVTITLSRYCGVSLIVTLSHYDFCYVYIAGYLSSSLSLSSLLSLSVCRITRRH